MDATLIVSVAASPTAGIDIIFNDGIVVPNINVAPAAVNFGDVGVGSGQSAFVTISNVGDADLTVSDIRLVSGGTSDFAITSAPALPAAIAAGGFVEVAPVDLQQTVIDHIVHECVVKAVGAL